MITEALLMIVGRLIDALVRALPDWEWHLPGAAEDFVSQAMSWNGIVPVHETMVAMSALVSLVIGMHAIKWGVKLIDWIADVLP